MHTRKLLALAVLPALCGLGGHWPVAAPATLAQAGGPAPSVLASFDQTTTRPLCPGAPDPAPWMPPASGPATTGQMPPPLRSFDGINRAEATAGANPDSVDDAGATDTSGAAGPTHYVQTINQDIGVFDKAGNRLCGPVPTSTLFGQVQGCGGGFTDAIVLYDHFADRWLISRFARQANPAPGFWNQCVAISTSPDPTGTYFLYGFHIWSRTDRGPNYYGDYPKFGITPNDYYMEAGACDSDTHATTGNKFAVAFNRAQMLAGQASVGQVEFFVPTAKRGADSHMMPADVDGPAPPAGSPEYYVETRDQSEGFPADEVDVWALQVDWSSPGMASFTQVATLPAQSFDSNYCDCIPQPGTSKGLKSHSALLMFRTAYRAFGDHESIVLNEGVAVGDSRTHGGILWFELQHQAGAWRIAQQQTAAPDAATRWLASIAMDQSGDIALAYNVASSSLYPGIRYGGRLGTDPPGTLPQAEATLVDGGGSDLGGGNGIGDYAELTLDPSDDCTFWYTSAYVASTTQGGDYHTRIGAFRFPSCGSTPPPQASSPGMVSYAAGWNLVAGSDGTLLPGASGALYTLQAGDTDYETVALGTPLKAGQGYWAYFPAATTQTLASGGSDSIAVELPANRYVMLGNPSLRPATVSGADVVYVFDPSVNNYVASTTLAPGQGAWVLVFSRRRVTIVAH